jgi:hypothetical protein
VGLVGASLPEAHWALGLAALSAVRSMLRLRSSHGPAFTLAPVHLRTDATTHRDNRQGTRASPRSSSLTGGEAPQALCGTLAEREAGLKEGRHEEGRPSR